MRISDWSSDVCSSDLATVQGSDASGDRDRGATAQADDGGEERIGGRLFRPMGNGRPAVLHLLVPEIADMGGQFGIMVADGVQLLVIVPLDLGLDGGCAGDRKSTRLNSSH